MRQRLAAFDVEVVGRLVEDEEIGRVQECAGQRDAAFLAAGDVTDQVSDNELVLGVVVSGKARAYPLNMLTGPRREIINDKLGGRHIAATW